SNVTHRRGSFLCLGLGLSPKLSSDPSSIMLPKPPALGGREASVARGLWRVVTLSGVSYRPLRCQFNWRKGFKHFFFRGRCQHALHGKLLRLGILRAPNAFGGLGKIVKCPAQSNIGSE